MTLFVSRAVILICLLVFGAGHSAAFFPNVALRILTGDALLSWPSCDFDDSMFDGIRLLSSGRVEIDDEDRLLVLERPQISVAVSEHCPALSSPLLSALLLPSALLDIATLEITLNLKTNPDGEALRGNEDNTVVLTWSSEAPAFASPCMLLPLADVMRATPTRQRTSIQQHQQAHSDEHLATLGHADELHAAAAGIAKIGDQPENPEGRMNDKVHSAPDSDEYMTTATKYSSLARVPDILTGDDASLWGLLCPAGHPISAAVSRAGVSITVTGVLGGTERLETAETAKATQAEEKPEARDRSEDLGRPDDTGRHGAVRSIGYTGQRILSMLPRDVRTARADVVQMVDATTSVNHATSETEASIRADHRTDTTRATMFIQKVGAGLLRSAQRMLEIIKSKGQDGIPLLNSVNGLAALQQESADMMAVWDKLTNMASVAHVEGGPFSSGAIGIMLETESSLSVGTIYEVIIHPVLNVIGYLLPRLTHLLAKEILTSFTFDMLTDIFADLSTAPALAKLNPAAPSTGSLSAQKDPLIAMLGSELKKVQAGLGKITSAIPPMPQLDVVGAKRAGEMPAASSLGALPPFSAFVEEPNGTPTDAQIESPKTPIEVLSLLVVDALRDPLEASITSATQPQLLSELPSIVVRKLINNVVPTVMRKSTDSITTRLLTGTTTHLCSKLQTAVVTATVPALTSALSMSILSTTLRSPVDDLACGYCAIASTEGQRAFCTSCARSLLSEQQLQSLVRHYSDRYAHYYQEWYASFDQKV